MRTPVKILDITDLQQRSTGFNPAEVAIQLQGGYLSRKLISYCPDRQEWWVCHLIDETEYIYVTTDELLNHTTIGKALEHGALWFEGRCE